MGQRSLGDVANDSDEHTGVAHGELNAKSSQTSTSNRTRVRTGQNNNVSLCPS